jgi:acetate---CoA ligase (ADP-forming)
VLGFSEGNDVVVFCSDSADNQPMGRAERALDYVRIFAAAAGESSKPHYLMGMRSGVLNRDQIEFLKPLGIPVIGGTRQGLGAVDRLARYAQPLAPVCTAPQSIPRTLAAISNSRHTVNEFDSKRVLAAYGLPTVREVLTSSLSDATTAARELGYPVALKLVSDDVPHKSEGGFLAIGLKDEDALNSAWEAITGRVAAATSPIHVAGYLVQQMINEGTEVFAGISRDPDFGLTLGFGQGGTEIEVIRDFSLRSLPLRQGDAETMIGETRQSLLLDGFRGRPAVDRPVLVRCLEALADLASAEGDLIAEIDLNPSKVLPAGRGCVVLDALIVTRSKDGSERSG